jgi:DNA excision repair protein ERCC-1
LIQLAQIRFDTTLILSMAEEYDDSDFLYTAGSGQSTSAPQPPSAAVNGRPKVVQPKPQALPSRQGHSAILVSTRQKGNPILNNVKSLPWEYSDIPCDYVLGATTCALFLSLKYHRLHPEYIYSRIRQLGKLYNLRILLTMVDITNHEEALKELSKTSMINSLTLVLCWSAQEAGRYLELFKSYEHASPASIRAHQATTYQESLTEFVTTPRNINKTDAASLVANFGSLRAAVNAQPEELALVPGWGEKKVRAWSSTVREPFRVKRAGKSNIDMLRREKSTAEAGAGNDKGQSQHEGSHQHIPIGAIPIATRNQASESQNNDGPSAIEEFTYDDIDEDEEAALLAAAESEARNSQIKDRNNSQATPQKEPELSVGIMAALAKLRDGG